MGLGSVECHVIKPPVKGCQRWSLLSREKEVNAKAQVRISWFYMRAEMKAALGGAN